MINVNIDIDDNVRTFLMPEEWSDVTVEQLQKISALDVANLNEIEKSVKMISIFGGIEEDILFQMSPPQFMELTKVLEFTNVEIKSEPKESIMLGGEEYFMKSDYSKLTLGEVMSIQIIMSKSKEGEQTTIIPYMDKLLCILLRKKIDGKLEAFNNDFMERAPLFKKATITDVYDLVVNFSFTDNL